MGLTMFYEDDRVFVWQERDCYKKVPLPIHGPYFIQWQTDIGVPRDYWHKLEDLLKITGFSATIKKRLNSCKPGNAVDIHHQSRTKRVFLQRLSKEEIIEVNEFHKAKERLIEVQIAIKEAAPDLHKEKNDLDRKIKAFSKKYFNPATV